MNIEEFKQFLIDKEHIYPDYCKKENMSYNGYEIYSPQFNNKYIGLPIFYLIDDKDNIIRCNEAQVFKILALLEKND